MHHNETLTMGRLRRVLAERIRPVVHEAVAPLAIEAWHVGDGRGEPVPPAVALPGGDPEAAAAAGVRYEPFAVGRKWGPAWGTTWFHVTGNVPDDAGDDVELIVDLGWQDHSPGFQAEGLVYRPDGSVVKALNPRNAWIPAVAGESVDLYIEAAANPLLLDVHPFLPTEDGDKATARAEPIYTLARADINVFHRHVWELVGDFEVLGGLAAELGDTGRGRELLGAIAGALDAVDLGDVAGSASAARARLAPMFDRPAAASAHRLTAIGHAHIDSAWLWPVRETVRKVARTSSNVLGLLDSDPDFKFAMSSAQQYEWIKDHRPELWDRVKDAVAGGRFIPVGGMWVESDTNMVGSEAMARQFIYGQRFFRENFGVTCKEVWLPDSFGYSAALPQIVKSAGARWFLTQKISWNQENPFPHHTFQWEGIDGTRVFTHFPPADTYNSDLSAKEIGHAERNFRDKGAATRSLVPFGWGDGGGGPTREMLARAKRTHDLEGSARVSIESPREFFEAAEAEYPDAPVWKGELYLELHRGTYTSQALTKQGNRRSEHLLAEAELWSATAAVYAGHAYPYDDLERLWKLVLLQQFHDILPGSSIAWVHREAAENYAQVAAELRRLIDAAQSALDAGRQLEFNASPFARHGVPAHAAAAPSAIKQTRGVSVAEDGGDVVLDNGVIRARLDARGLLTSVYDIDARRELIPDGRAGNLLQLHQDFPNMWDAWDIDRFYKNTAVDLTVVDGIDTDGTAVVVRHSFGASTITQRISIEPGSRRVDFENDIDWHESEKLLKLAFPIDVHADSAAYETQFGHIFRPTHENTSWDNARFEVCAHRWVHVGETGYGAAVANDSTYGHDVSRHPSIAGGTYSTVRLSLVRGPKFPDPRTDQGRHVTRCSLVVGAEIPDAVEAGYALNLPERAAGDSDDSASPAAVAPLLSVAEGHVIVETVKLAEDRSGDVIARVYEPYGARARARLSAGFPVANVVQTNLLEDETRPDGVRAQGDGIELTLRPFQIVTVRLTPADADGRR
ncbi:alpha-mannosidase [Spelaeicoccus albus]|uniref:Alpha-mannosidase n=1 Tax=Spelaeicoccus albus TaxID=1280376 RepID=A0A7Z0D1S7_9MICO|nr:glycoside hydrolase family 38 C-terminal domain-containing protein [Spelaeicoccus albus]NYI66730.1 alpha-mannosidase [Spelaeicoccus albus]